jgi:carbonic anhydrase
MSAIDEALKANHLYAENFSGAHLLAAPVRKLAILTCMDSRMDLVKLLGHQIGDAHMIRNAGGIATEDAIRSLIISHHVLGTEEVMIINHTDCGLLRVTDSQLVEQLEQKTGIPVVSPTHYYAFTDLAQNVRQQMARIRNHPYTQTMKIRGFIYDVKTGHLTEVHEQKPRASTQSA